MLGNKEMADLRAENIALRNLVRDLYDCSQTARCESCPHYHAETDTDWDYCGVDLENRLKEWGFND